MRCQCRANRLLCSLAALLICAVDISLVQAEPTLDRVLGSVQVANQKTCAALSIAFNLRIRYMSHFPVAGGTELRIALRPIDSSQAAGEILTRRESLRAPESKFARIRAIDFEAGAAAGPVLVIQFDTFTNYEVSQGDDFQSIVVKLFGKKGPSQCNEPVVASGSLGRWSTTVASSDAARVSERSAASATQHGKGTASAAQKQAAAAAMDEGRAAMRKGNLNEAINKYTSVLKLPETEYSAEAQEFLALARQRNKQTAEARAEYEDYLRRYPTGDGADRVRQRLAGLVTASGDLAQTDLKAPKSNRDDGSHTWTLSGSASQFYIRDDSFRTLRDPSIAPTVNDDIEKHQNHQNELLTSLDAIATWSGNGVKSKLRFSGTEEHKFDNSEDEIVGVAALFLDTAVRDWGLQGRVGRQTRNSGGVLGRFDGALLSFETAQPFRINAVAGSPVLRRRDAPFEDDKLFYGASIDFGPFYGFDTTLFAIEQRDRDILDRQAVGAELRFVDPSKSAFATIDYDIHYQELNAAILNGSWTLEDKSTLHGAFDYRKSPYLSTWTALQGQVYPTLYEMLKTKTLAEIEDLALDRTASFTTISAGLSRPINETFQFSLDATATNYGGTPASGGVAQTDGTGNEYFYSAQIIGNNVVTQDDLVIAGLRFADLSKSDYYVMDLSVRYPLMEQLKINPRLMLGYRTGDTTDLVEYSILPTVLFNYYVTRDLSLELEVGARWTSLTENSIEETSTELFFTVGYRYDFYADGASASPSRAAPYGINGPR